MTGGKLQVDLTGLEDFASRMDAIRSQLESSQGYISGFDADLGDPRVVAAVDHFNGNWSDGRKHVEDNAKTLSTMVHEAVKSYRATDQKLASQLARGSGGRPGAARA
jgi:hypothetical protein